MSKKGFSYKNIESVRKGPGVYKLYNPQGSMTYVGKAKDLPTRLEQHKNEGDIPNVSKFEVRHTDTSREAEKVEKNIIQRSNPVHNLKKP